MSDPSPMFQSEDAKQLRYRQMELDCIAKNRWYLGQKLGREVTWNEAEWDFLWSHRKDWLAALKASGEYPYD